MALTKTIELVSNFGDTVVFNNAYIVIETINGSKNDLNVFVCFKKEENGDTLQRRDYSFIPSLEGDNFIKQAYLYLKTLPEFQDAIDC